ncbi:MAG: hypothetical protein IT330_01705 [Anaerolineae bacterium]|nr:hypothetical protein [Anaerolineae bacterium]
MDPASPPFLGWERPERNFYRLPHTWFATLARLRRAWQLRSIANLIRLVEYIIRWTWGEGHFDRPIRLTLDELEHGKVTGRRKGVRIRADTGCGISGSHLGEAIQLAVDLGLITREVDRRDLGRVRQFFAPRLAESTRPPPYPPLAVAGVSMSNLLEERDLPSPYPLPVGERVRKRVLPLPNGEAWEDRMSTRAGEVPREYSPCGMRGDDASAADSSSTHRSIGAPFPGFPSPQSNYFIVPKGWTSLMAGTRSDTLILAMEYLMRHCWGWQARADEVHFLTADEVARGRQYADGIRYDDGIGYSVERTRDALERAVADGWLVVRERTSHGGRPVREYTLRRLGWTVGEWEPSEQGEVGAKRASPLLSDVSEGDTDISAGGTDASAGGADISAEAKDLSEGDTDASAPRAVIPTLPTNETDLPAQKPPPPNRRNGGGRPGEGLKLRFTSLAGGQPVEARGYAWDDGRDLGPDEVLLTGEDGDGIIVVPVAEAARLLAADVDTAYFGWAAGWWALDGEARWELPGVNARCERVRAQASALWRRREEWGDDDLVRALARHDVAPETAARWIARWGEERVGAWLATLRRNPRVETVAGLLLRKLQSGQTPPAWVMDGKG